MFMPILPVELVVEILSCLPVKTILRFRCVCREWCNLIDGKHFVVTHLTKSTQNRLDRYLVNENYDNACLSSVKLEAISETVKLDISSWWPKDHRLLLWASCNGLVCLSSAYDHWEDIALWNPSINKHLFLPPLNLGHPKLHNEWSKFNLGLGFDSISNDYKVVLILECLAHDESFPDTVVKVYSLRSNSWRRVDGITKGFRTKGPRSVLIKGSLHWLASHELEKPYSYDSVVAFAVSKEEISIVPTPSSTKGSISNVDMMSLQVIEGCLSVGSFHKDGHFDLWIMENYGVSESWTKLISISVPNIFEYKWVRMISYTKNIGLLLMAYPRSLAAKIFWHDFETKAVKQIHVSVLPKRACHADLLVMESLVPLNGWAN